MSPFGAGWNFAGQGYWLAKPKLPVVFASLHPLFGVPVLQELLLFSLTVLRICIRKMLLLNMEMEGNPVQVTQENFQQEKPMITACNLG